MPWRFALHHVNYEMSNFQPAQLVLPWSICCVETKVEEMPWRPLWTTYPKLRNLDVNGSAVPANRCAEKKKKKMFQGRPVCDYQGYLTGKGQLR